jgi:hypothetical protein
MHNCNPSLLQSNADLPAWAVLSSAAMGAFAYWFAIFPVDVIKSSMQTDNIIRSQKRFPDMVTTAKVRSVGSSWLNCSSLNQTYSGQRRRYNVDMTWLQQQKSLQCAARLCSCVPVVA